MYSIFIFLNLLLFNVSIIPNWNLKKSAKNLLDTNTNTNTFTYTVTHRAMYKLEAELKKTITRNSENGAISHINELFINKTSYGNVQFENIESFYHTDSGKRLLCPIGKHDPINLDGMNEIVNSNTKNENWDLKCYNHNSANRYFFTFYFMNGANQVYDLVDASTYTKYEYLNIQSELYDFKLKNKEGDTESDSYPICALIKHDNKIQFVGTAYFLKESNNIGRDQDKYKALIDAKNMPKDNSSLIYNSTYKYPKTMPLIKKPNISSEDKDKDIEESQEETEVELTMNENVLDVYFGECIFEDALEVELGYNMDDILSFFSVDFYMHETQTSDILAGKNPMFNFQILFKVDVNEPLLNYLENECMNIELYSLRDNAQIALGEGKISLKELLKMGENVINSGKKIINSECDIFYKKNKNLKIATIHYQMRMIKPLSEALKWYYQQNKYNEEGDKYQESIKLSSGLNLNEYANIGKKAYEVKILITKAINLIIQGPPRRIAPYIYYEFYKNGGRYSKNGEGMNPIFEDMASYNEIMTQEFLDYITKNALNVYIFDSMNQ